MGENNREMILEVIFSLIIFTLLTNGDQCLDNSKNIAVYEGQPNTIMNLYINPQNVSWTVRSTSKELELNQIIYFGGQKNPSLTNLYDVNQTGLIIKDATTNGNPISTAGMYVGQCENNPDRTGAKLLVVHTGPQCSCTPSDYNYASNVSCNVTFADSTFHPIYPIVTWKLNGTYLAMYTLPRKRVDAYVFYAESTITSNGGDPGSYTCELTFAAPTDIELPFIATNAPEFNESCSTPVCGEAISIIEHSATTLSSTSSTAHSGETNSSPIITTEAPTTTWSKPANHSPTTTLLKSANDFPTTTGPKSTNEYPTTSLSKPANQSPTTTWSKPANDYPTTTTPSTIGRYSNSSLIRKPTNTAAVAESSNITLECASSHGTNAILWSFTPLGSFSNETIQISKGYQLLTTSNQQYVLHATDNSSILVVCQLSSLTEGTYGCYDGVESASVLLLMISSPISMEPLFGPMAGGTNITITDSSANDLFISSFVPKFRDVRNVYIGNYLSATSLFLLPNGSSTYELVAVTPSTTKASIGQPLPIIIEFSPTPFNMTFNTAFTYLPNPEITGVYPNSFIVNGGILLNVFGKSLSSVAKPIIQLTVVITRSAENNSTSNTSTTSTSRVCTVPPGNDTYMQCPMPPLNLPEDFLEMLNVQYNTSTIRRKRDIKPGSANVLTVRGQNGIDRADIYLGFILDGYKEYENINDALPDTKFTFYSAPEINSSDEIIEFDPSEDELIYVKGRHMLRGCLLRDYVVRIGNQICINDNLMNNQLSCRPPKEKPSSTVNDTIYCDQHLSITITVGYKQYQYACLMYTDYSATKTFALIVGLTVGLSGFALFLTILIVCIIICRRRKGSQGTARHKTYGRQEFRNPNYNAHYDHDVHPQSQAEYAHRIQGYDDDISANEEYLNYFDDFDRKSHNPVPSTVASDGSFNLNSNAVYENSRGLKLRTLNLN